MMSVIPPVYVIADVIDSARSSSWMFWVGLSVGIIALFVIMLPMLRGFWMRFRMWRQRRKSISASRRDIFLRSRLADVARGGREGEESEPSVLRRRVAELKQNFVDGLASLSITGADAGNRPWYLLVGGPKSGRSSLMKGSDLDLISVDGPGGASSDVRLRWWFHPNGTIVDPCGEVLNPQWGNRGAAEYRELLKLIHQERKTPEIQGIVMAVEASELMLSEEDLQSRVSNLRSILLDTNRVLGLDLPVYLVVTKCDEVEGLPTVMNALSSGFQQRQMVGWSSVKKTGDRFDEADMKAGMKSLAERMSFVSDSLLARNDVLKYSEKENAFRSSASLFGLPDRIRKLGEGLTTVCSGVFGEVAALHNCSLRGVYLTSVNPDQAEANDSLSGTFIRDIFVEKVFRESGLSIVGKSRFRKVYLTMVMSLTVMFTLLGFYSFGTIFDRQTVKTRILDLDDAWAKAEPLILQGHVVNSPMVGQNSDGSFSFLEDQAMSNSDQSRGSFLAQIAEDAYEPIPLPGAYRLASMNKGTFSDNLLWRQRRLAYRSIFNPMVVSPLVNATITRIEDTNYPWTPQATKAWTDLLQIEQAQANLSEDWNYTFDIGPVETTDLLAFVFEEGDIIPKSFSSSVGKNTQFNSSPVFAAATGLNRILSQIDIQALGDSLVAASAGSMRMGNAIYKGMARYAEAWNDPNYRESLPLGQAEGAVEAIRDFNDAVEELERLAKSVEVYTKEPPTSMEAQATVADWNAAYAKAEAAIARWNTNTKSLGLQPGENISAMVKRAIPAGEDAVTRQFQEIAKRTKVFGDARTIRSGQLLIGVQEELEKLQVIVNKEQTRTASVLLNKAKMYDRNEWLKPEPPKDGKTPDPSASKTELFKPELQWEVLQQIHARMASRSGGSIASISSTLAQESIKSQQLDSAVTDSLKPLGTGKDSKAFSDAMSMMTALANWNAMYWSIANTIDSLPQSAAQIAESVSTQVEPSKAWFRPGIPLTRNSDSGTFDPSFNPVVAEKVIAPWKIVRQKIDSVVTPTQLVNPSAPKSPPSKMPSIMMKGQPQLNAIYNARSTALNGYIRQYLDYWARESKANGQISEVSDWADYRKMLDEVRPFQVNSSLLGYLQQIKLALEASFLEQDPQVASLAKSQLADVQTQLGQLTPITTSSAEAAVLRWKSLPTEPSQARRFLLDLTTKQFSSRYFFMYVPGRPETVAFWDNLTMAGLDTLANSISTGAQEAIAQVTQSAFQWPILETTQRDAALTQEQIDEMSKNIGRFYTGLESSTKGSTASSGASGSATPKEADITLLAGGKTGDPGVDYEIARLRDGLLPSQGLAQGNVDPLPVMQSSSQRLGNVVMALSSSPTPLQAAIVQPSIERVMTIPKMPTAQKNPVSVAKQYLYVEIWAEDKIMGTRMGTMPGDGNQFLRKEIVVPADSQTITLKFFRSIDDTTPGPTVVWKGPWALINAYLNPQTVTDAKAGIAWIPVTFDDEYELECYWWFGLKLTRPLPPVDQWPTQSDWPEGSASEAPKEPAAPAADAPKDSAAEPAAASDKKPTPDPKS